MSPRSWRAWCQCWLFTELSSDWTEDRGWSHSPLLTSLAWPSTPDPCTHKPEARLWPEQCSMRWVSSAKMIIMDQIVWSIGLATKNGSCQKYCIGEAPVTSHKRQRSLSTHTMPPTGLCRVQNINTFVTTCLRTAKKKWFGFLVHQLIYISSLKFLNCKFTISLWENMN